MKPENELQADEVAFTNTCRFMALELERFDRGRLQFSIVVYGADGKPAQVFGSAAEMPLTAPTEPLTLEEFDHIVRDGEAKLPTLPPEPTIDLLDEMPHEVPPPPKSRKGK